MNNKVKMLISLFLVGIVDQVEGDILHTEISMSSGEVESIDLHKAMLPCEVSEGDMFYFSYEDGVTEIRCGEPPI